MGKLKLLLIVMLVVGALGGGAFFFFGQEAEGSEGDQELSAEELAELSIDTDVITTNLASANNFAIVQFNVLLSNEEAKEEMEKRKAELRAAIISTVAGFTKEELIGTEGIAMLEQELCAKLAEILEKGEVNRVLVTEFKLQ